MQGDGRRTAELTEAIYDAAVDPNGWTAAVALLKRHFRSTAEAFYYHDDRRQIVHPIHRGGIAPDYVRSYAQFAARDDYPWTRARPLRQLGVIRTEARLIAHTGDAGVMRRSGYFNEWLRPQRLAHSIGITLLAEAGLTAKLTLLRPHESGAFRRGEIADFEKLSAALRRSLAISRRLALQTAQADAGTEALDRLGWNVMVLGFDGRLLFASSAGERMLRDGDGLTLRDGRLVAADPRNQSRLERLLRSATEPGAEGPDSVPLHRPGGLPPVLARAIRLSGGQRMLADRAPALLLVVGDPAERPSAGPELLTRRYRLTPAELRLAEALVGGESLKRAAEAGGITYETARGYLKALFQKTGTGRQAELVARLLHDLATPDLRVQGH